MHASALRSPSAPKMQRESPRTARLIEDWKTRLRLQCHAQIETKRENAKLQRRKICFHSEVETAIQDRITQVSSDALNEDEMDLFLKILADVKAELVAEEAQRERELKETLDFEDRAFQDMLNQIDANNQVFCPICMKNYLQECHGYITCICGLSLEASVSLNTLRERLESASYAHSQVCHYIPRFYTSLVNSEQLLTIVCPDCRFYHIVHQCPVSDIDFSMEF